jgi:hypothetical protein
MQLRHGWFAAATAAACARASRSDSAGGKCSGRRRRMASGTQASTRAASEGLPTTASIAATSASRGPMWRAAKESCGKSPSNAAVVRWATSAEARVAPEASLGWFISWIFVTVRACW